VYSPPPPDRENVSAATVKRRARQRTKEPLALQEWRARMADQTSTETYRRRSRIEATNGILKARGMATMLVRSLAKVRCVALLQALAHNLWRAHCLKPIAA